MDGNSSDPFSLLSNHDKITMYSVEISQDTENKIIGQGCNRKKIDSHFFVLKD